MTPDIEARIVEYMKPLFGEFAVSALQQQKAKVGLSESPSRVEYMRLVEAIRTMCAQVAGPVVAANMHAGLVTIIREVA